MSRLVLSILIIVVGISVTGCTAIGYQAGKGVDISSWVQFDKQECSNLDESI